MIEILIHNEVLDQRNRKTKTETGALCTLFITHCNWYDGLTNKRHPNWPTKRR